MSLKTGIYTDFFISVNFKNLRNLWSLFFFLIFSFSVFADDFPARSNRLVTDYAGILSTSEQDQLESKLVDFNNTTSTQIAVVIIKSIGGYEINDYAVQLGNKWGIGQQGKNNGILVLLAIDEHKVSIQIGYGLEGAAPDVIAKRIIENEMIPYFKQGDYYSGLDKGTDALMQAVKGEYTAEGKGEKFPWFVVFIILFIIIISIAAQAGRTRNYARTNHIPFWTAWWLLSQARNRQRGSWGNFSSGRGGFGGGGGGFGGFGGGGFGGGGASGSW